MANYKLIALDIDGTLARNDRSLSQRTIDTLVEAQRRGLRVVIASGRPTWGISHVAEALQPAVIADNGELRRAIL